MSSARVQKMFEGMPEAIKRLGGYTYGSPYDLKSVIRWQGRVTSGPNAGLDAMVLDIDSAAWADNNRRAILVADPASDLNKTAAMKTQSHAAGTSLDGSVRLRLYLETPEDYTGAQHRFQRIVLQHLLGQLGAPVEIFYGTNDVEPRLEGVNGASAGNEAACSFASAGVYLPYGGVNYPGGV
jgi:hypothetical protein